MENKQQYERTLKLNALSADYFLKNNVWSLEELEAYRLYCLEALKNNYGTISSRTTKRDFLKEYDFLKGLKNEE